MQRILTTGIGARRRSPASRVSGRRPRSIGLHSSTDFTPCTAFPVRADRDLLPLKKLTGSILDGTDARVGFDSLAVKGDRGLGPRSGLQSDGHTVRAPPRQDAERSRIAFDRPLGLWSSSKRGGPDSHECESGPPHFPRNRSPADRGPLPSQGMGESRKPPSYWSRIVPESGTTASRGGGIGGGGGGRRRLDRDGRRWEGAEPDGEAIHERARQRFVAEPADPRLHARRARGGLERDDHVAIVGRRPLHGDRAGVVTGGGWPDPEVVHRRPERGLDRRGRRGEDLPGLADGILESGHDRRRSHDGTHRHATGEDQAEGATQARVFRRIIASASQQGVIQTARPTRAARYRHRPDRVNPDRPGMSRNRTASGDLRERPRFRDDRPLCTSGARRSIAPGGPLWFITLLRR